MAENLCAAILTQEDPAALEFVILRATSGPFDAQECTRKHVFLENSGVTLYQILTMGQAYSS